MEVDDQMTWFHEEHRGSWDHMSAAGTCEAPHRLAGFYFDSNSQPGCASFWTSALIRFTPQFTHACYTPWGVNLKDVKRGIRGESSVFLSWQYNYFCHWTRHRQKRGLVSRRGRYQPYAGANTEHAWTQRKSQPGKTAVSTSLESAWKGAAEKCDGMETVFVPHAHFGCQIKRCDWKIIDTFHPYKSPTFRNGKMTVSKHVR